jgi:hypothetical protein
MVEETIAQKKPASPNAFKIVPGARGFFGECGYGAKSGLGEARKPALSLLDCIFCKTQ